MKKIITYSKNLLILILLFSPVLVSASEAGSWYDSGSYYDNSWTDSGSYYDSSWVDSGTYYDNSWYDSGSYYDTSWVDSGSYYDNSWYDSGTYYDNSWTDSGSYYDSSWVDSGTYYNTPIYQAEPVNVTYGGSSIVYPTYNTPTYNTPTYSSPNYQVVYENTYGGGCTSNCGGGYNPPTGCTSNCGGNNPPVNDLDVICTVSRNTIDEGETVTFEAEAFGGTGSLTYRWTGDFTSNNRSVSVRFDDYGTYDGTVRVTDSRGQTATANCDVTVREEDDQDNEDFDAVCKVSDRTIEEGDRVTFTAEVDGGDRPFEYDWSGDVDSSNREFTARFDDSGRYTINLKVTDDEGRIARDTCEIRVSDDRDDRDDDDDRDVNVSGTYSSGTTYYPPSGGLASVGSVYLNQVPYTGPEDVAKGVAFVGLIIAWSIAGAFYARKRLHMSQTTKRIALFKEANKNS